MARADSAGASHDFVDELVSRNIGYSLGFAVDARVRDGLLLAQEEHWEPARNLNGTRRENGYVIELTDLVELDNWGAGCRVPADLPA